MLQYTVRSRSALARHVIIHDVTDDTLDDQSERSERVLNSAMLIENGSASVASVTDCNDCLHPVLISAILIMRGN